MEFRLNAAVYAHDSVTTGIPVFPVQMMLVDRESRKILIGPGEMTHDGETLGRSTMVFDDEFRILQPANQIIVHGPAYEDRQYRLFLRPSLEFWCPRGATSGFVNADSDLKEDQDFLIMGSLILRDSDYVYSYPARADTGATGERLEFNRLHHPDCQTALGFTAFVDFDVEGGLITSMGGDRDEPLVLKIDATACGHETGSGQFERTAMGSDQ